MKNDTIVKPSPGWVFMKPVDVSKTGMGLDIPEAAQEKLPRAEVLACGPSIKVDGETINCPAEVGEIVLYKEHFENNLIIEGEYYILAEFNTIMGVLCLNK